MSAFEGRFIHWAPTGVEGSSLCGVRARTFTSDRQDVTCPKCLASPPPAATASAPNESAAKASLAIVRSIVAEMREDATRPKGGQTVSPRRMPVPLSIILELERALGPDQGEYAAQAYYDLTAEAAALRAELDAAVTGHGAAQKESAPAKAERDAARGALAAVVARVRQALGVGTDAEIGDQAAAVRAEVEEERNNCASTFDYARAQRERAENAESALSALRERIEALADDFDAPPCQDEVSAETRAAMREAAEQVRALASVERGANRD